MDALFTKLFTKQRSVSFYECIVHRAEIYLKIIQNFTFKNNFILVTPNLTNHRNPNIPHPLIDRLQSITQDELQKKGSEHEWGQPTKTKIPH